MFEEETDAALVARARADDTYAFDLLIERYQMLLLSIALRYARDEETARELVQEALLQAYLSLDRLRDDARFKSWLYGIELNICRNWLRASRGKMLSLATFESLTPDPQETLEEQELQRTVDEALAMLSPRNRTVAQLFYYEQRSMQEIAHQLAISLAAVKSRLHKGREQLRNYFTQHHPDLIETIRTRERTAMIPVRLAKIQYLEKVFRTVIVLFDEQGRRALPLWFTNTQAAQAQMGGRPQLAGEPPAPSEPLTTDFIGHIIEALGGRVEEVGIEVLYGDVLYARIQLRAQDGKRVQTVKARLDDALPLALHLRCPLAVAAEVLNNRGVSVEEDDEQFEQQIDAIAALVSNPVGMRNAQTGFNSTVPRNLDFSQNLRGWSVSSYPIQPKLYEAQIDSHAIYGGEKSLAITMQRAEHTPDELLRRNIVIFTHEGFLADDYRGLRLRMVISVKYEQVSSATFRLTVMGRATDPDSVRRIQHSTDTRLQPIEGSSDWTRRDLVIDVPDDAFSIQAGLNLAGEGKLWLAPIRFEAVDNSVPLTGTRITPPPQQPQNLDFAQGLAYWNLDGSFPQDYSCAIDHEITYQGHASLTLRANGPEARGTATLQQTVNTYDYQGKRIRLSAMMKTVDVEQEAALYLSSKLGTHGERVERRTQGSSDWTPHEMMLDVSDTDLHLNFGLVLRGKGQVWLTNLQLTTIDKA